MSIINTENPIEKTINKSFNNNCSITLLGMPGTGKSVVAEYINSKNSKFELIELDKYIEDKENSTLFKLIEKYGEIGFKDLEEKAILSIDFSSNITKIISTGGSVIYSKKGMQHFKNNNNLIIYLNTPFATLVKRTESFTNRGIVFNGQTINELYNNRRALYEKYSDITIDSADLSISEIGNIILEYF